MNFFVIINKFYFSLLLIIPFFSLSQNYVDDIYYSDEEVNYNFLEKYIIKVIMWITNGPTDTSKTFEFTDWEDVKKFSDKIN